MKRNTGKLLAYLLTCLIAFSVTGSAQVVSKKEVPSNIPADVRQNILALQSANAGERANAACALGKMGSKAVASLPFLIELFNDTTSIGSISCWAGYEWAPKEENANDTSPGKEAAKSVAALGPDAIKPLVEALSDQRGAVRSNAAWALGEIRGGQTTNRTSAVAPLKAALNDTNWEVRAAAAEALGEIASPSAVDPLIGALADANWQVRWKAAWALAELKNKKAVQSLIIALNDSSAEVRQAVADALGEIKDRRAAKALRAALEDESPAVRQSAQKALDEILGN